MAALVSAVSAINLRRYQDNQAGRVHVQQGGRDASTRLVQRLLSGGLHRQPAGPTPHPISPTASNTSRALRHAPSLLSRLTILVRPEQAGGSGGREG